MKIKATRDQQKKMLEERAKYIEKTRNIVMFDDMPVEKPTKKGGKVGVIRPK